MLGCDVDELKRWLSRATVFPLDVDVVCKSTTDEWRRRRGLSPDVEYLETLESLYESSFS